MKRLMLFFSMILVLILSACMAEEEPYHDNTDLSDYLSYSWESMTFTTNRSFDILIDTGNAYDDYIILLDKYGTISLTEEQALAYKSTFSIFDQIDQSTDFEYGKIATTSAESFIRYSDLVQLELTTADVISYYSIKSEVESLKTMPTGSFVIQKQDYVEYRLNRELTIYEINSLDYLQSTYSLLVFEQGRSINFKTSTFDEVLTVFNDHLHYTPNDNERERLLTAYNILQELYNTT